MPTEVAIIAIGRNEGRRLVRCLDSLKRVTNSIVYVDSGSSDDSTAVAQEFGATVVNLDLSQPFTAARARNEGFAALKSLKPDARFVQFIDGDCILAPNWIDTALCFMEKQADVAVVCGRRREIHRTQSIYNLLCDIEWDTPIGETSACGGDALVRVEAFEAVSGFRSDLIAGEEPELCVRLRKQNWKIWRLDADMTLHDAAMTRFVQWWLRTVRGGHAFAEVSRLHWTSAVGIWKRETMRAIFWGGLVPVTIGLGGIGHPGVLLAALLYPLQTCRIAFARGPTSFESWTYASFMTVAKFAEFQGILKFHWHHWRQQDRTPIEYKRSETTSSE